MENEPRANDVVIANIHITEADKDFGWALPKECRWFTLQVRDGTAVRVAIEPNHAGVSEEPYFTIKADNSWDERYLDVDLKKGLPLFFACGTAGKVVEVIMGVYNPDKDSEGGISKDGGKK